MKVAFVYTSLKLYWIPRLVALQKALSSRNIDFVVIEVAGNSTIYDMDNQPATSFSWWKCIFPHRSVKELPIGTVAQKIYQQLSRENPDVIVSGSIPFPCGAASVKWVNDRKKKIIIFDDVKTKNVPRSALVNFVKQKIYSRVDAYLAPSERYYPDLKFWKFAPENIFIGLNCIDNNFFERRPQALIQSYPFKNGLPQKNTKYLICVARLVPIKNHKGLLKAWKQCTSKNGLPNWKLLIAGSGPLRSELEGFVEEQAIPDVLFLDSLTQQELPYYYSISSALVLPSFEETWGLVVNEAMAAGLPVLVSNQCNCLEDLVQENVNGYSFNPCDVHEISNALLRLAAHPDLEAMGAASKNIISKFSLKAFTGNVLRAINHVQKEEVKQPDFLSNQIIKRWKGRFSLNG